MKTFFERFKNSIDASDSSVVINKNIYQDIQEDARQDVLDAEHKLSEAYVRLRRLIPGALDTPYAPTPEQVYFTTEQALEKLLKRIK